MFNDKISVLILAGGRSRRMGQDKLWLMLDGMPMIERVIRRALPLAGEILISANAPEHFDLLMRTLPVPSQVVPDLFPGAGPLAGIHSGLRTARHDLLLALAADLPFVNGVLVRHMVELAAGFDAVVPQTPHPVTGELGWEPLHALYRRSCLPAIAARLGAGERQAFCFYPDVRVRAILPPELRSYDPTLSSFLNVNTPEDWAESQQIVQESGSKPTDHSTQIPMHRSPR